MRILHVMAGAKNGGSESIMLDSVLALAEAGVAQHVVTRGDDAMRLRSLSAADIPFSIADFDKIVRAPTVVRLRSAFRSFEPDVLHFWLARAAGFALPKWRDISLGWHGARHRVAHFKNCAWQAVAAPTLSERLEAHEINAERIALLSPFAAAEQNPAAFERARFDTPENAVLAAALGAIGDAWEAVLEALARIDGMHLWHVEAIPANVAGKAKRLGLLTRLHHAQRTPRAQLIAASDIVLCGASDNLLDGAVIDAWAQRKPVICIGASALARHESDALIAPPKADALEAALQRLLSEGELAQRLSENGRRAYRTRFTKAAFVQNAMTLYERVRGQARTSRAETEAA